MNKSVEEFLQKKEKEAAEAERKKKDALLIELGLYDKEYSVDNKYSAEYPESEWNSETGSSRYFKKVPMPVSDEEYAALLKYKKGPEENNTVSVVFKVLAWIVFIGGIITGAVLGRTEVGGLYSSHTEFSFIAALPYWAACFVGGMIFLGFAEIIQLLHDIKRKNTI
ncbi:MAG: hypothetical protein J5925_06920 [Clostridia bacterium]|nr:hypothetical protein [Clostridia bacterium]